MKRNLTCIVCPIGCSLVVELDESNNVINVTGNTCPRGEKYAISECTNPERVVTTTIMCDNGQVLPVKTNKPIPKGKIFECMEIINKCTCKLPVSVGDVIISDVFGADIVATKNME
jgi:CxxC motif-containing protein